MQCMYRSGRGEEDTTCTLLNMMLTHLEGTNSHVHLCFIDFSSAFNWVQPNILARTLTNNIHLNLTLCDLNIVLFSGFFNRSQRVRVNGVLSNALLSSSGEEV